MEQTNGHKSWVECKRFGSVGCESQIESPMGSHLSTRHWHASCSNLTALSPPIVDRRFLTCVLLGWSARVSPLRLHVPSRFYISFSRFRSFSNFFRFPYFFLPNSNQYNFSIKCLVKTHVLYEPRRHQRKGTLTFLVLIRYFVLHGSIVHELRFCRHVI